MTADLADQAALSAAFEGADAVFHCAAAVSVKKKITKEIHDANVEGVRRVVLAAKERRVGRLVHCSTVNAVGLSEDGRPCTEEARWNFPEHGMADAYTMTKHQAEELLAQEGTDLDWVVVNPCYMLGPYDTKPTSGKLIVDVVKGKIPGICRGSTISWTFATWCAGWFSHSKRASAANGTSSAARTSSYRDIIARIAQVAGVKAPTRDVPRVPCTLHGTLGRRAGTARSRETRS